MPTGPASDSLTIRHTSATVPGGARPGWGLPFEQLPASNSASPEQDVMRQIEAGRKNIQQKYALQWETVNSSAKFIGPAKHQAMLREIDAKAKQEMMEFNQQAEAKLAEIKQIDNIASAGGITPDKAEELKVSRVYGRDVAQAMFPDEQSVPRTFGALQAHKRNLDREIEQFRVVRGVVKPPLAARGILSKALGSIPVVAAASAYRTLRDVKKAMKAGATLQVLDTSIPAKDDKGRIVKDKYGDPVMGDYRDARPEEVERYQLLLAAKQRAKTEQDKLLGGRDVKQRVTQPGTQGGTFGDKIRKSADMPDKTKDPFGLR